MIQEEKHSSENNFNNNVNLISRTNHKSHVFVREDILKEFEEFKNDQNLKLKNSNFAGKIKTMGSTSNERSFLNRTGANADSKSLDGLSFNFNNNNINKNHGNYTNKDVLLHELLGNLREKYKNNENSALNNPSTKKEDLNADLTVNQLKRQFSRRKDGSINKSNNISINKSMNKSMNQLKNESFDYTKRLNAKANLFSDKTENKQKSFLSNNDSRGNIYKSRPKSGSNSFIYSDKNKSANKILNNSGSNSANRFYYSNNNNKKEEKMKANSKEKIKLSDLNVYYNNIKDKYQNKYSIIYSNNKNNKNSSRNQSNEKKFGYINKPKKSSENLTNSNSNAFNANNKNNQKNNFDVVNNQNIYNNNFKGLQNGLNHKINNNNISGNLDFKNTALDKHRKNNLSYYSGNIGQIINSRLVISNKESNKDLRKVNLPSESNNNNNNNQNANYDYNCVNIYNFTMGKFDENYKNISINTENNNNNNNNNTNNNQNNFKINKKEDTDLNNNEENNSDNNIINNNNINNKTKMLNLRSNLNSEKSCANTDYNLPKQVKINSISGRFLNSKSKSIIGLHKNNNNNNSKSKPSLNFNYNSNKDSACMSEANKTEKSSEIAIKFDTMNNSFSENNINNNSNKNLHKIIDSGKSESKDMGISNYEKYYNHLLDKKTILELKIQEFKEESEQLAKILNHETLGKYEICSKLENEIGNYKHMSETCLKNCNQLTIEILSLKKEIEKYINNSSFFSSLSTNNNMSSKGSKNTVNEKLSGMSSFVNMQEKN